MWTKDRLGMISLTVGFAALLIVGWLCLHPGFAVAQSEVGDPHLKICVNNNSGQMLAVGEGEECNNNWSVFLGASEEKVDTKVNKPPYQVYASFDCDTTCVEACAVATCNTDDVLVGGGGYVSVGDPANTGAGDNVALQKNWPMSTTSWQTCGRELQNTPGQGGYETNEAYLDPQVSPECAFASPPGYCFPNWNSGTDSSISATGLSWTVYSYAICRPTGGQTIPTPVDQGDVGAAWIRGGISVP